MGCQTHGEVLRCVVGWVLESQRPLVRPLRCQLMIAGNPDDKFRQAHLSHQQYCVRCESGLAPAKTASYHGARTRQSAVSEEQQRLGEKTHTALRTSVHYGDTPRWWKGCLVGRGGERSLKTKGPKEDAAGCGGHVTLSDQCRQTLKEMLHR